MNKPESDGFWDDAEVIHSYTREQAIADGVLVDISAISKEAGFKVPVAATAAVWAALQPRTEDIAYGQSINGRLWDVLAVLKANARDTDTVFFTISVARAGRSEELPLKAVIGPGDRGEPVVTIMEPNED